MSLISSHSQGPEFTYAPHIHAPYPKYSCAMSHLCGFLCHKFSLGDITTDDASIGAQVY